MMDKIRHFLFNHIGYPTDVQNLLNYIESFNSDVCIYPSGEYRFEATVYDGTIMEPKVFLTPQEREAFSVGLNHGVSLMGGQTFKLSNEQWKEYEEMENLASVKGNPKKMN